jgi:mono/diheme cytochrome c family protein
MVLGAAALMIGAAALDLWRTAPAPPITGQGHGTDAGRAQFTHGNFGAIDLDTLATSALPWTVLAASLALGEANGDANAVTPHHVARAFRRFGFLDDPDAQRGLHPPHGMTLGVIQRTIVPIRLQAVNLGCAACHSGVSYGPDGAPRPDKPWPGMPNTSLDLEAYTQAVFSASAAALKDDTALWAAIDRLFPDLDWRERLTLRLVALPLARARIGELERAGGPLPFSNGGPGRTNGVAALKLRLGQIPAGVTLADAGFVSIPDLGDRGLRTALLADGAYALPGKARFAERRTGEADWGAAARIGAFFTVPSMGMTPTRALAAMPALEAIGGFLATYRPQPYPGPLDRALVERGRDVYARACADCHGTYDASFDKPRLLSFPNWAGEVGTDMSRARAMTPQLAAAVSASAFAPHLSAASTGKVAAPPLSGVWASAPYLVNGSVPTLRHLLEPDTRPTRFDVGGHRLDLGFVGIAGRLQTDGVWRDLGRTSRFAASQVFDTTLPGQSNQGHADQVSGLTEPEREALLEYLKLL